MTEFSLMSGGGLIVTIIGWSLIIVAFVVVPINRRPTSAMAWLLFVVAVPFFGFLVFLILGSPKLPKVRRRKQQHITEIIRQRTADRALPLPEIVDEVPEWFEMVATLNLNLGAMPLVRGNAAELHDDYNATILTMAAEVDKAEQFVHCEFYILCIDETTKPFFAALAAAKARGVTVRVLLDHVASHGTAYFKETKAELERMGAEWHVMLPFNPIRGKYLRPDLRNHRKLLVIDGKVGFVGSQNLIDRTYDKKKNIKRGLKWQELVAKVEGPIVEEINGLFLTDWYSETDELLLDTVNLNLEIQPNRPLLAQIVPSGPGFDNLNNLKMFNSLFYNARKRLSITSPYFVPEESLVAGVTSAAERGVEVELFVCAIGDQALVWHAQRSYYEVLLRAGVRIYLYPAPFILHAKHMSMDDHVAVIGSSNMDIRSFELNLESTLLVYGESFVDDVKAIEDHYREISEELTLEAHLERPFPSRVLDNLARLTSAVQ
jgi:cardiolipin synthase